MLSPPVTSNRSGQKSRRSNAELRRIGVMSAAIATLSEDQPNGASGRAAAYCDSHAHTASRWTASSPPVWNAPPPLGLRRLSSVWNAQRPSRAAQSLSTPRKNATLRPHARSAPGKCALRSGHVCLPASKEFLLRRTQRCRSSQVKQTTRQQQQQVERSLTKKICTPSTNSGRAHGAAFSDGERAREPPTFPRAPTPVE